jgi:homoserine kinase
MGAGFDTLGLALDRYLDVAFEPGGAGLTVRRSGTLTELDQDAHDLIASTFLRTLRTAGADPAGVLSARSDVPFARGLGSSAAAVLAGFDLARAALGLPHDRESAFAAAYTSDGHGDNAAPCLLGGLRAVAPGIDGLPRIIELPLSDAVGFAFAAPSSGASTTAARSALPRLVTHRVAAAQLGRITALVAGLATGDPELIRIGTEDELHVPFRLTLIPNAHNAIVAAGEAGAWAATISGAGTGLIAFCEPRLADAVARAMRDVFAGGHHDPGCLGYALRPDRRGLVRLEGDVPG